MPQSTPIVFLSHAQADLGLVLELEKCLVPLVEARALTIQGPHRLLGGDDSQEHHRLLCESAIIVLLISSDYGSACIEDMQLAVSQHDSGAAKVLPVLLRPTPLLRYLPIGRLPVQPLRPQGKSVVEVEPRDSAWEEVSESIAGLLRSSESKQQPPPAERAPLPFEGGQMFGLAMLNTDALRCDRDSQWGRALDLLAHSQSCVILLPGELGQAHTYFEQRIARLLPGEPTRVITAADWPWDPFPRSEPEYREALAVALNLDRTERLVEELRRILIHRNIVLLHRAVSRDFDREQQAPALLAYYTEWLPRLLDEVRGVRGLKCVQPLGWPTPSSWRKALARRLRFLLPGSAKDWLDLPPTGRAAQGFMKRLLKQQHASLPIFRLPRLEDIGARTLLEYCERIRIPNALHTDFVAEIQEGASTMDILLQNIARAIYKYTRASSEAPHGR